MVIIDHGILEDTPTMWLSDVWSADCFFRMVYLGNATSRRSHWVEDYQKEVSVFSKFPWLVSFSSYPSTPLSSYSSSFALTLTLNLDPSLLHFWPWIPSHRSWVYEVLVNSTILWVGWYSSLRDCGRQRNAGIGSNPSYMLTSPPVNFSGGCYWERHKAYDRGPQTLKTLPSNSTLNTTPRLLDYWHLQKYIRWRGIKGQSQRAGILSF